MARTPPSLPTTPNALSLTPLPLASPFPVTPARRVPSFDGPRRSTPPAVMARRPRDHRLSLEFILQFPPPPAATARDRHRGLEAPVRHHPPGYEAAAPLLGAATSCLDGKRAPTSGNGGHPPWRDLDPPSLVPRVLLPPPPRIGSGGAPRALPPARGGSPIDPTPPSSGGCQGGARVGRAQRAALEARAWAASRATAVEQPPPPRSPPAHAVVGQWSAPWAASPHVLGGGAALDGGRGWCGIGVDSPVSMSPVAHLGAAEVRLRQGTCNGRQRDGRRLQPLLLASSRPSDGFQPNDVAGGLSVRPPSVRAPPATSRRRGSDPVTPANDGTAERVEPARTTTNELDGGGLPLSSRRIASPPSTARGSKLREGAVARARVPCSRGCGHTFGNRSGMMAHARCGGVTLILLLWGLLSLWLRVQHVCACRETGVSVLSVWGRRRTMKVGQTGLHDRCELYLRILCGLSVRPSASTPKRARRFHCWPTPGTSHCRDGDSFGWLDTRHSRHHHEPC